MDDKYLIKKVRRAPSVAAEVGKVPAGWKDAEVGVITNWHSKSGTHRPLTYFRALYDRHSLYIRFDVMDRHVRVLETKPQEAVCGDSCVESFIQPAPGPAYFNFEINGGGTILLYFIEDHRRIKGGFARYRRVDAAWLKQIEIGHSLPRSVKNTIPGPIAWSIAYRIPFTLFTAHLGELEVAPGAVWRGNFYKCGGDKAYSHWGSWSDVGAELNFHQPDKFGQIIFGD